MPVLSQLLGVERRGRLLAPAAGTVHRADRAPARIRPESEACPATLRLQPGFRPRPDRPSPQSQSFSRSYGSGLPTSLTYIVLSARGCSPWRPAAVMGTTRGESSNTSPGFSRTSRSSPDAAVDAALYGAADPLSGRADSRVSRPLTRKDNSSRGLGQCLRARSLRSVRPPCGRRAPPSGSGILTRFPFVPGARP